MKNKEELLDAYFQNSLSVGEQRVFDDFLENDQEFLNEFNFQKSLKKAITITERASIKNQLNNIKLIEKTTIKRKQWIYYSAASVVLIIGLMAWIFSNSTVDYQKLYSQNYEQFPNIVYPNVRSYQEKNILLDAFAAYDNGDYKTATVLFEESNGNDARFYQGLSEMQLGKVDAALVNFEKIDKSNFNFNNHLYWYKALCYIKSNDVANAKRNLQLIEEDPIYKEKVKTLLSSLE